MASAARWLQRQRERTKPKQRQRSFVKQTVADAVHQAVVDITGESGVRRCPLYAWAGWAVVGAVTGRIEDYTIQVGGADVLTADADGPDSVLSMDPNHDRTHFHAWIAQVPPSTKRGMIEVDPRTEVIDFSLRHMRALADDAGCVWTREPLPDYYWGPWSGLVDLDVRLYANERSMAEIPHRQMEVGGDVIKAVAKRAMELVGN